MTDPLGGQSAATGTGQSAVTGDQGTGTATDASGQSAATGQANQTPTDNGQSTVSREEFERLRTQLAAADKKRAEAEQQFAQLRDKDVPALQKAERDLQEAQTAVAQLKEATTALRVENAFLTDNTFDWHSPQVALAQLDRSKITVDVDGNVTGMKDALKALAQAHPFLLKPKTAEGTPPAGTTPPASPGTAPSNGGIGAQQGTAPDKAAMAKRFPAMKSRLG